MICFIAWNTSIAGGVQNLIISLTKYFYKKEIIVSIVGYKDSFIIKQLNECSVKFNFYDLNNSDDASLTQFLTNKTVVFTSFSPNLNLYRLKTPNPKILYWNVFPGQLKNANRFGPINYYLFNQLLTNYLVRNHGCVFMDFNGFRESSSLLNAENKHKGIDYLPIPVSIPEHNQYIRSSHSINIINISYVGRGSIWKIYPLIKVLTDISALTITQSQFKIHVITQEKSDFEYFIKKLNLSGNIEIIYITDLYGKSYLDFLVKNIDLHISMGTAALDGASLGIPTILIDFSYSHMPANYKYRWIYETTGFDLGHNAFLEENSIGRKFSDILQMFFDENCASEISKKCYEYVQENHNIEVIADKLLKYAAATNAYSETVLKYTLSNNYYVRQILGILGKKYKKKYDT